MERVCERSYRGSNEEKSQSTTVHFEIGRGVVILLGIGHADGPGHYLGKNGHTKDIEDLWKIDQSLLDVKGAALVVSQFTLYAIQAKGVGHLYRSRPA
jgi:D-Tyr-tRNAtyr deacylase